MDYLDLAAKILAAVIAKLIADGIEVVIKKALHSMRKPRQPE